MQGEKKNKISIAPALSFLAGILFFSPCLSEVVFDGTLKPKPEINLLSGNIVIEESLGSPSGKNIFYSFSKFNIKETDSVQFVGDSGYQNILSRITDAEPSLINGSVKTSYTSSQPSLFLINPNGIMFGSHADIDIQGSFFTGTAKFIEFDDERVFSTNTSTINSKLTNGNPVAFGFLDESGTIQANVIKIDGSKFSVSSGEELMIIGGDIDINKGKIIGNDGIVGSISLVSLVNSDGKTYFSSDHSDSEPLHGLGKIFLQGDTSIFAERVNIEGKSFAFEGIDSDDVSGDNSDTIVLGVKQIMVNISDDLLLNSGAQFGLIGDDSTISIIANSVDITNQSALRTSSVRGDILIAADQIVVESGSIISVDSVSGGNAGKIEINANNKVTISGYADGGSSRVSATTFNSANSGSILITADTIEITDSGEVRATANGTTGTGGKIQLVTQKLKLSDGSRISTEAFDGANGGSIVIITSDSTLIKGGEITAASEGQGLAGSIIIDSAGALELDGGVLSVSTENSDGGNVFANADEFFAVTNNSEITSSVKGGDGSGGSIILNTSQPSRNPVIGASGKSLFLLKNGSKITTSVHGDGGLGDGGNIVVNGRIGRNGFVMLDSSEIRADTDVEKGLGGAITIRGQSLVSKDVLKARITASAPERENFGEVSIFKPDLDVTTGSLELPETFFDASSLIANRCIPRVSDSSSFYVGERGGLGASPDSLLAGYLDDDGTVGFVGWFDQSGFSDNNKFIAVQTKIVCSR